MELNQEPLPDQILIPLKEAREIWLHKGCPTNRSSLARIAMDEALDNMNSFIEANQQFEDWIYGREG